MSEIILQTPAEEMDDVLRAVRHRYGELHPNWELILISVEKTADKTQQLDRIIEIIEKLKQQ